LDHWTRSWSATHYLTANFNTTINATMDNGVIYLQLQEMHILLRHAIVTIWSLHLGVMNEWCTVTYLDWLYISQYYFQEIVILCAQVLLTASENRTTSSQIPSTLELASKYPINEKEKLLFQRLKFLDREIKHHELNYRKHSQKYELNYRKHSQKCICCLISNLYFWCITAVLWISELS
jgi:hypothetical protein